MADDIEALPTAQISSRDLSHKTTKILSLVETESKLVAITKYGRIVAALLPASAEDIIAAWIQKNPASKLVLGAGDDDGSSSYSASEMFGGSEKIQEAVALARATPHATGPTSEPPSETQSAEEVGVRQFASQTSHVLRAVENGGSVLITKRNRVIAVLVPFTLADLVAARMARDSDLYKILTNKVATQIDESELLDSAAFAEMIGQTV